MNEEDVQTGVAVGLGLRQVLLPWDEAVGPRGLVPDALDLSARSPSPLLNFWAPAYDRLAREGTSRGCTVILTGAGGDERLGVTPLYAADLIRTFDAVGLYRLIAAQRRSHYLSDLRLLWNGLWLRHSPARLWGRRPHRARRAQGAQAQQGADVDPALDRARRGYVGDVADALRGGGGKLSLTGGDPGDSRKPSSSG